MRKVLSIAVVAALGLVSIPAAQAKECGGVEMPNRVRVGGEALVLNGLGLREATAFKVDVYVAGLYVSARSRDVASILAGDKKKRLTLRFVRDVDRSDITEAFEEGFRKNGGSAALTAKIRRLNGWMAAMHEGDSLTFTYVPESGLEVRVGNRVKGTIEGADFATAFFKIWLGPKPPNRGLRTGLLGGECD